MHFWCDYQTYFLNQRIFSDENSAVSRLTSGSAGRTRFQLEGLSFVFVVCLFCHLDHLTKVFLMIGFENRTSIKVNL